MFFGPGQFPKEFFDMMEKLFVEKVNEAIRNPSFLAQFSKAVGTGLEGKKKADEVTLEYLEKLHLPSKEDFARQMQYLQQIESRIIAVEEKVDDLLDVVKPVVVVKKDRKPAGFSAGKPTGKAVGRKKKS